MASVITELSVCQGCLCLHANGEWDPDDVECVAGFERWHEEHPDWHLAVGGEHRDGCPNRTAGPGGYVECDCDDLGFSWSACDVCGVHLGGDRYRMTVFGPEEASHV